MFANGGGFGWLAVSFIAGTASGAIYFGGLWWTVRRIPFSRHPIALYLGSVVFRLIPLVVVYYYFLVYLGWLSLLMLLVGFFATRVAMTVLLGPSRSSGPPSPNGESVR